MLDFFEIVSSISHMYMISFDKLLEELEKKHYYCPGDYIAMRENLIYKISYYNIIEIYKKDNNLIHIRLPGGAQHSIIREYYGKIWFIFDSRNFDQVIDRG